MEIEKLWQGIDVDKCATCEEKECKGRLHYGNLCSNVNYLKEYGEKNYNKNKATFVKLKKIWVIKSLRFFRLAVGLGLTQ